MLTDEQMKAYEAALTRPYTVMQAPPGCGKSHVLREVAAALTGRNETVLVTAFNLLIVRDMCKSFGIDPFKMGDNGEGVTVLNFDKITARTVFNGQKLVGRFYALGNSKRDTEYLAKGLGVDVYPIDSETELSIGFQLGKIESAYAAFCASGDDEIGYWHIGRIDDDDEVDKRVRLYLVDKVKLLMSQIDRADGKKVKFPPVSINTKFSTMKRYWKLAGYPVAADAILIDEAQDLPGVFLKAIDAWIAQGKRVILAGDEFQELYAWAGARNSMNAAVENGAVRNALTKSHRFGPTIAATASEIIEPLAGPESVIGLANDVVDDMRDANAYLHATNAEVIATALELKGNVVIPKSLADEVKTYVKDIDAIYSDRRADGPLRMFNRAKLEKAMREDDRLADVKKYIQLHKEYGAAQLIELCESMGIDDATAGTTPRPIATTMHRTKGMEWSTVEVKVPTREIDPETKQMREWSRTERMMLYVAVTRAKQILRVRGTL